MILEHKKYDLFGEMIFEKIVLQTPFKKSVSMPEEACFFYIVEGVNISISGIEKIDINTREAVLMKCGNYISKMLPSGSSAKYQAIAVHFNPEVLKKIYRSDLPAFLKDPDTSERKVDMAKIGSSAFYQKYINSLLFYFENPEIVNEELLVLKLKELILLLTKTEEAPVVKKILSGLYTPAAYSLKQVVDSHIFSDITIEDLAKLNNLSLSSFHREFKKVYNYSPAKYIKERKLERAAGLLLISDERISDIAYNCGFNDLAHFSKFFHQVYNVSPSDYRLTRKDKSLTGV